MNNVLNIIVPLITLFLGGLLGFVLNIYLERFKHKQTITKTVIEKYIAIRDELSSEISELANLNIQNGIDFNIIDDKRKSVSKIYYKYYDFLPSEVLQELNCLYACLSDKEHSLYKCTNNIISKVSEDETENFLEKGSLIKYSKYYEYLALMSRDEKLRISASINIQSRMVFVVLNSYFTIEHLSNWIKNVLKYSYKE